MFFYEILLIFQIFISIPSGCAAFFGEQCIYEHGYEIIEDNNCQSEKTISSFDKLRPWATYLNGCEELDAINLCANWVLTVKSYLMIRNQLKLFATTDET